MSQARKIVESDSTGVVDALSDIDPQSNVLVCGPAMVGKRAFALELLSALSGREWPAVVSTSRAASALRQSVPSARTGPDTLPWYVVDAVSKQLGTPVDRPDTWYVSSPSDLTNIGVATGKALTRIARVERRPRVVVDNLSTLLLYNSLERVYRFLHVLNGRIALLDGISIQILHTDPYDERELGTLTQLFDTVCQVSRDDDTSVASLRSRQTGRSSAVPLEALRARVTSGR